MACYLVCYDITDDAKRQRVASALIEYGCYRLQKSVFAGEISDSVFPQLLTWLKKYHADALQAADSILILPCTPRQLLATIAIGAPPPDWGMLTQPPNTLIL